MSGLSCLLIDCRGAYDTTGKEAWPAETPKIVPTSTPQHFKPDCIDSFQTLDQASAPTSNMCCFPWLSALFSHSTWLSSDVPAQPLLQEPRERNFTSEYHGYQPTKPMSQLPRAAIRRDQIHLVERQPHHGSFNQSFKNQLMYQRLGSMQQLPQPSAVRVKQEITSIGEPLNNGIQVGHMTYTGNIERSYFAKGTFLTLKEAMAEIHTEEPHAQWGHVRVERLLLEEGWKEALEVRLRRGLTPDELRSIYQSILKIEANENAWSTDELWGCILRRKEKGSLSDLFDVEDLDWIK